MIQSTAENFPSLVFHNVSEHKQYSWNLPAEVAKRLPLDSLLTETDTPYFPKREVNWI